MNRFIYSKEPIKHPNRMFLLIILLTIIILLNIL